VYRFLDDSGRVLYVGKAKYLDSRLGSYFRNPDGMHARTATMVASASEVTWVVTASETEALVLEQAWIHQWRPRFNVRMKDSDSKYPSLALTIRDDVPRLMPWRGERKRGIRYFGPYPGVNTRELIDALLRAFPMRSCNSSTYASAERTGRPCLLGDIGKCSAPCVGRVGLDEHKRTAERLTGFLSGQHEVVLSRLTREMEEAAADMDFERAARRRDEVNALRGTLEKQAAVTSVSVDADAVSVVKAGERLGVAVISARRGSVVGARSWTTEHDPLLSDEEQVDQVLSEVYTSVLKEDSPDLPRWILLERDYDVSALTSVLSEKARHLVESSVPKSGARRELVAAASRNAEAALVSGSMKRAEGLEDRASALEEIGEAVGAGLVPWRIECIDIAHISGTLPVASLVVFEDGRPATKEYRRLNLSDELGGDDFEGMREAVTRRLSGTEAGMSRRPDLLVVDGGPGQVEVARQVLEELGVTDVALCGLAKRLEELWLPLEEYPVILGRESGALMMLQQLRDEAHRVANTAHRKRREKKALVSALETIKGLGPVKRRALMDAFGTVGAIASASLADLEGVDGMGPDLAARVHDALR
jgi:excinuclease ABC subunit C